MNTTQRPEARPSLACTCATGECARTGHVPQLADCGHPGVYRHAGRRSVCIRPACFDAADLAYRTFPTQEAAGRAIGALTGATGRPGGWIYDADGEPICQGWASYAHTWAGIRSGGISTMERDDRNRYLIGETGLRRIAAHLDRLYARREASAS